MTGITIGTDGITVDAALLAEAFHVGQSQIRREMREGRISSRCEKGTEEDTGRWRLTFYREGQALRLVVDAGGGILSRGRFPVGTPTRPGGPGSR